MTPTLPPGESPGLAIGLGGVGLSLRDLVQLYCGLANGGRAKRLRDGTETVEAPLANGTILDPQATWQITDILAGVRPPEGASQRGIAYKTGTSYGYRDAWSIGYDGRYVLGVWTGRPDSGAVPGLAGYKSAAPHPLRGLRQIRPRHRAAACSAGRRLPPRREDLPLTLARFVSPRTDCPCR